MIWKFVKKHSWLVALIASGLTMTARGAEVYSLAESKTELIDKLISVFALPTGIGIVVFGAFWLTSSAFIWRREQKLKAEKRENKSVRWKRRGERLVFGSDALMQLVERCEDLLNRFQSSSAHRIELESELNALWLELERLRIPCPRIELWGDDENSQEWVLFLARLKPLMKTVNIEAARDLVTRI